ncbi:uncharacterized protein LOC110944843 [Helianthus annuus]|uniref:uncharacterized protein LOC110944843 n=1 Tax=Helianthus annuus TaxID=4232 RepID=UPI000B90502A|nr:uncharacterized protein LOC110944843 [Helianthus annuus]
MPIAYALVDEETVHSWCWFFQNLKQYVIQTRKICVISDRHAGIIHAMENLEDWMEPRAYHRYCLRHVRSNFSSRFSMKYLRKLCWMIGSTTQSQKYRWAVQEMRMYKEEAWDYLNNTDKSKWTLRHDHRHRRWGNLTTNISESMNNVLRQARLLPIKVLIRFTFTKDVSEYVRHTQLAARCNSPLPPRIWSRFNKLYSVAMQHEVSMYDAIDARYSVVSKTETNDHGGNEYTIEYNKRSCSCGKWQMLRFPCSHAIAVCYWRGEEPHNITHSIFHTTTYRQQYSGHFYNLGHKDEWAKPDWRIKGDPSRVTTHRGRMRSRRIQNELDINYHDEPQARRCSKCGATGHNRKTCGQR